MVMLAASSLSCAKTTTACSICLLRLVPDRPIRGHMPKLGSALQWYVQILLQIMNAHTLDV